MLGFALGVHAPEFSRGMCTGMRYTGVSLRLRGWNKQNGVERSTQAEEERSGRGHSATACAHQTWCCYNACFCWWATIPFRLPSHEVSPRVRLAYSLQCWKPIGKKCYNFIAPAFPRNIRIELTIRRLDTHTDIDPDCSTYISLSNMLASESDLQPPQQQSLSEMFFSRTWFNLL